MSETQTPKPSHTLKTHTGGCHCGAVRFEAELDLSKGAGRCNCTICTMVAQTGVIVKPSAFRVVSGADQLTVYRVGSSPNSRSFCRRCGIQVFGSGHVPEIGGDFVSVNLNCVDEFDVRDVKIHYVDGRHNNWMAGPRDEPWPVRA